MGLQVYNTLSQQKESFVPLEPGKVKIYVCGPTVYNFLHVGNFRGPVFFNLVRNWLERSGYEVTFALNFTDVDDKIIERAKVEGKAPEDVSEHYIAEYKKDIAGLHLRPHDHNPKVTEYMKEIIQMIDDLLKQNMAYVVDGEVLYSVRRFQDYGKLSHRNVDDMLSGARVEVDEKKKDPLDFALWKPAKPGEPKWSTEWGEGRPGWHIECSAMIRSLFGDSIDIHGGGMDLVFPHHENEIAQSEGATGKPFVKYWLHWNMLNFGDKKMSKSLGNIVTGREFMAQYGPEIFKFMMLSAHYRSVVDFSEKQVHNVISGLARIYSSLALADEVLQSAPSQNFAETFAAIEKKLGSLSPGDPKRAAILTEGLEILPASASLKKALTEADREVTEALNDDFNTPVAFASIYNVIRAFNAQTRHGQKVNEQVAANAFLFKQWCLDKGVMMALFQEPAASYLRRLDDLLLEKMHLKREDIDQLVAERGEARKNKDFKKSDELRDKLTAMGIALHDTATGTSWEVHK